MRSALLTLLGEGGSLKPSFKGHRRGFLIRSHLSYPLLRQRLVPLFGDRLVEISPSKPVVAFLEPSAAYLSRSLGQLQAFDLLCRQAQGIRQADFFSPQRMDRFRRLPACLSGGSHPPAAPGFSILALRLEGLPWTPRPDRQWLHLAEDFDRLWQTVPLSNVSLRGWQRASLEFLVRCSQCWRDESSNEERKGAK